VLAPIFSAWICGTSWHAWFEAFAHGQQPRLSGTAFSQTSLALDAAEHGLGVALVPRPLVERALNNGTLVVALNDSYRLDTGADFYMLTGSTPAGDSATARVIAWLEAEARTATPEMH